MKNIFANVPTFEIELKFYPLDEEDQTQLEAQKALEREYAWLTYCETQALFSKFESNLSYMGCPMDVGDAFIKCIATVVGGPKVIKDNQMNYPLLVKNINLMHPSIWTAHRIFYHDTPEGIAEAQAKVVYDVRNSLSSRGVQQGYAIRLKSEYGDETIVHEFGPFEEDFTELDCDIDPEWLVKSLHFGFDGTPYQIAEYIDNKETPIAKKEIARKGLAEFCIQAGNQNMVNRKEFSLGFWMALCDFTPKVIQDEKVLSALKEISKTLPQSKSPLSQPKSPHTLFDLKHEPHAGLSKQ